MTLFPEPEGQMHDTWPELMAQRLYLLAKAWRKSNTDSAPAVWQKFFSKLRRIHGASLVQKVLGWYEDNAAKEMVPAAWTGEAFYGNFSKLMKLQSLTVEEEEHEEIPQAWKDVAESLLNRLSFPPEIAHDLPIILKRTGAAWFAFRLKLETVAKSEECELLFISEKAPLSHTFMLEWAEAISGKLGWLENYYGSTLALAFKPDSPLFIKSIWRAWVQEWTGFPERYDSLLKRAIEYKE